MASKRSHLSIINQNMSLFLQIPWLVWWFRKTKPKDQWRRSDCLGDVGVVPMVWPRLRSAFIIGFIDAKPPTGGLILPEEACWWWCGLRTLSVLERTVHSSIICASSILSSPNVGLNSWLADQHRFISGGNLVGQWWATLESSNGRSPAITTWAMCLLLV